MGRSFIISCESTVDVPYSQMEERGIPVIFYHYVIDGVDYVDDMGRDPEARPLFYKLLGEGKLPSTSLINQTTYKEFFENLLEKGDVLHISFTSGQSASCTNAFAAADEIHEEQPDKKLLVIDSLCSSSGYGLIVNMAADLADQGKSIDEVYSWILENRNKVHHQFFSSDMTQFKRTGRVSGPTATIATILNICPTMRLDDKGRIIAYGKVRGKKKAVQATVDEMLRHAQGGKNYDQPMYIACSNCPEDANMLKKACEEAFPNVKGRIQMYDIGTIIASHAGYGTVAAFFMGDERAPE